MDVQKITDKITLYKGSCNTYYINDKKKTLIDAGVDFQGDVDLLVLTHFHPDHVLHAGRIKERCNCEVLIGWADAEPLSILWRVWPSWEGIRIKKIAPDRFLKEGDMINTGLLNFRVLEVPGHTIGSIALWEENAKILFTGDTLFAHGIIGRIDFPYSDPQSMEQSIQRLKDLKPRMLLPGHGEIVKA